MLKRERIVTLKRRAEEASADLLAAAEQWTVTGMSIWDLRNRRTELFACARRYARALERVRRS